MLLDLIRALPVAVLVCLLPGWFWARLLDTSADRARQLAYSIALSMALVPAVALVPVRLLGSSVTLAVAVASPLVVFVVGLLAYLRFGSAKGPKEPLIPPPGPLCVPALALMVPALALALGAALGYLPGRRIFPVVTVDAVPSEGVLLAIALLVLFAGIVQLVESRREPQAQLTELSEEHGELLAHRAILPAVLLLALLRGYLGPVLHDWPFIRGVDHYSHAVMTNLMMSKGEIKPYLIYPPGFHTLTAQICRVSGLDPLALFSVLAPSFLLLPTLALYALASRLWGRQAGVAAALLSVLLGGTYYYYNDAMYPNLLTSQFLLVLSVSALVGLYASPSARSCLLFAILGSSVVLYHQVASLYLAALLAVVGLVILPYLLVRERRRGVALLCSLGLVGVLSVVYAWDTYDLPQMVAGLLTGSEEGSTGAAMTMAIGTQAAYPLDVLIGDMVTQPIAWLGLLGVLVAAGELFLRSRRGGAAAAAVQTLSYLTLLIWTALLFAGSRTPLSGFPQRFGRDLGVPLALFAALALAGLLRSVPVPRQRVAAVYTVSLAAMLTATLVGAGVVSSLKSASGPSVQMTITPQIAAAGRWLEEHNRGGNIMVSPHGNQVPSRMMLAMGHYSALQSFEQWQITHPRDLPPTGAKPLEDVLWVMHHPASQRSGRLLGKYQVSYIVLYKNMPDRPTADYWKAFEARPDLYRTVFENRDVLIVVRRKMPPPVNGG
jgi:hypothetical protein